MKIFIDKNDNLKSARGGVYALGNFDGVHLGHPLVADKNHLIALTTPER